VSAKPNLLEFPTEDNPTVVNAPQVHLNLNVRGLSTSATLAINERSQQLAKAGYKLSRLGLGQSPFPVPPEVVQALKDNAHQKDYLPVQGLPQLRQAVANYYREHYSIERNANDVLIGPGSKELLFILQLVYYGELVIPAPSWVSYMPQAQIIGRQIRWIPTRKENNWLLMPDELELLCAEDPNRPRLLILNYPSNPTGVTYSPQQLQTLAQVARRYQLILLADEIYGELNFNGEHQSIASFYPEGTIISSGLSKWCGAGGWRLGAFVFPESLKWLLKSMMVVASETFTSTSAPIQYAAVRAYEGGEEIRRYLSNSRKILHFLGSYIAEQLIGAGVDVVKPMGGFYLFPDFKKFKKSLKQRNIQTSPQLCEALLQEAGVAILPGTEFGRPASELTARLAFVDFDGAKALQAVGNANHDTELTEDFLNKHCANVLDGISRICDWLTAK
jgi:aspartate aminotransferase